MSKSFQVALGQASLAGKIVGRAYLADLVIPHPTICNTRTQKID
jgi:hypothetical protein